MPNTSPDPRLARRRPSDQELEKAAEVTELDVDAAVAQFDRDTASQFKGILDAVPADDA